MPSSCANRLFSSTGFCRTAYTPTLSNGRSLKLIQSPPPKISGYFTLCRYLFTSIPLSGPTGRPDASKIFDGFTPEARKVKSVESDSPEAMRTDSAVTFSTYPFSKIRIPLVLRILLTRHRTLSGNLGINRLPARIFISGIFCFICFASCHMFPATSAEEGPPPTIVTTAFLRLKRILSFSAASISFSMGLTG